MSTQCDAPPRKSRILVVLMLLAGVMCLTYGIGTCGYVWYQVYGSRASSDAQSQDMIKSLQSSWSKGSTTADPAVAALPLNNPSNDGTPFATVAIPRFGSSWLQPVVQGTALAELGIGVGHEPGSAMPGQVGNFAVAGHRTTHGRPFNMIADLQAGDKITVTTDTATYVYVVTGHQIVSPADVSVFAPVSNHPGAKPTVAVMTLSSCHPEYSATHRYIVHAKLVSSHNR